MTTGEKVFCVILAVIALIVWWSALNSVYEENTARRNQAATPRLISVTPENCKLYAVRPHGQGREIHFPVCEGQNK